MSRLKVAAVTVAMMVWLAFTVACGGSQSPEETLESVNREDLALMVLPPDAYGESAMGLRIGSDSGFQTKADTVESTLNPLDSIEDLGALGYIAGYDLRLEDSTLASFVSGQGVFFVFSSLALFEGTDGASSFLENRVEAAVGLEGQMVGPSVLVRVSAVAFEEGGLDAREVQIQYQQGPSTAYLTLVSFRQGPISATVGMSRTDSQDVREEVRLLAQALSRRIVAIAEGTIQAQPVPLPELVELVGGEPQAPPYPEEMALELADLPPGALLKAEGYVEEVFAFAEFVRAFDASETALNAFRADRLENTISIFLDEADAMGVFLFTSNLLRGGPDVVQALVSEEFEIESNESIELPGLGDEAIAFLSKSERSDSVFFTAELWIRVGRAIGYIYSESSHSEIELGDLLPLAEILANRMAEVLARNP